MKMYIFIPLLKGFDSGLIRSQSAASVSLFGLTREQDWRKRCLIYLFFMCLVFLPDQVLLIEYFI